MHQNLTKYFILIETSLVSSNIDLVIGTRQDCHEARVHHVWNISGSRILVLELLELNSLPNYNYVLFQAN